MAQSIMDRVHQMYTNEDGWFVAATICHNGRNSRKRGTKNQCIRTFYVVNHGTDISSKIRAAAAYAIAFLERCIIKTYGGTLCES